PSDSLAAWAACRATGTSLIPALPSISIHTPDPAILPALRHKIDRQTKPLGRLGVLEALALLIGLIEQSLTPSLRRRCRTTFVAQHGRPRAGVSLYPPEVPPQMVHNYRAGGAATNVFARQHGFALQVVDAGVNADF